MAIYLGAILAGIVSLWLTLRCTLAIDSQMRASSVSVFGLRAPLGVFLAGWGGLAMLTSAPFDNWWHAAYGVDLGLVSPPHAVLLTGVRAISLGMSFLILAEMNRATEAGAGSVRILQALFLFLAGDAVAAHMFFLQSYTTDVELHRAMPYIAMGMAVPCLFAAFSVASRLRWTATIMAAIYTYLLVAENLTFPLFSAHPRLGPVYVLVDHLVPAKFPIVLLVPAVALDLLWQRTRDWRLSTIALVSGGLFILLLVAVEWPFSSFLLSHASENRFFGTMYFGYNVPPDDFDRMRRFFAPEHGLTLCLGILEAVVCASASSWVGLRLGGWMRGVVR